MQGMKNARLPFALLLVVAAACGYPRPADVGDDGGPGDAPDPGATIRVSPSGLDANDGIAAPVKTLKHAIGLAIADARITRIVLASGTYSAATGEAFPYIVPFNITIAGPMGGGAILVGSDMLPGLTVEMGVLQDLDLQGFTTAITVTRTASLKNIRMVTSKIAVQAQTDARLTVNGLDVTGVGSCPTGMVLLGAAALTASNVTTRGLGTSLVAGDHSTVVLKGANATGISSCFVPMFKFTTSGTVDMSDSLLDGGVDGISIDSSDSNVPTQATLTGIIVRNTKSSAMGGKNAMIHLVGGKFSHAEQSGINIVGGIWSLTGVTIENSGPAIYSQDARFAMRDCMIVDNLGGVNLGFRAIGDLGTISSLGNNVFKNITVGLTVEGDNGPSPLQAVGNTWKASQGADQNGRYGIGTVMAASTACASSDNICIQSGVSVQL
jgi:hypothetical protein